jgi:hypothetical protein
MFGDIYFSKNWAAGSSPLNSTSELLVICFNLNRNTSLIGHSKGYLTPLRASLELDTGSCTNKCAEFNKETMKFTALFLVTLRHVRGTSKKQKINEFRGHDIVMKAVAVDLLLLAV